jgi:hypothetical protein
VCRIRCVPLFGRAARDAGWRATAAQLLIPKLPVGPRLGRVEASWGAVGFNGTCLVAGSRPGALPKKGGPCLPSLAQRTFLRRHRDEALQERGLGHYEQKHTNKRSRARWLMRLVFVLSRSCVSIRMYLASSRDLFGPLSAISYQRSAISNRRSAVSDQQSAIGGQLSAVSGRLLAFRLELGNQGSRSASGTYGRRSAILVLKRMGSSPVRLSGPPPGHLLLSRPLDRADFLEIAVDSGSNSRLSVFEVTAACQCWLRRRFKPAELVQSRQ